MEKWSLGYAIVKQYIRFAYWLSHKHIIINGKDNIPQYCPIIFAPNHQNALLDPLSVLLTNKTQPIWLARADIFKNKFTRPILHFLKILPVYRIRDGKENLNKNQIIFKNTIRILKHNAPIALFPEATHSGKRQMLSHKKAIPRIAFMAEEKFDFKMGLKIIPVGIYYSDYQNFNRSIIINYGAPIEVDKYKNIFKENEFEATIKLKSEIHEAISDLILNIKSHDHYFAIEKLRELTSTFITTNKIPKSNSISNQFRTELKLVNCLNEAEENNTENFGKLIEKTKKFFNLINDSKIRPIAIKQTTLKNTSILITKLLISIIAFPIFFIGLLLNGIPFFGLRTTTKKLVKDPIFRSSFNFAGGLIIFPIFYITTSLIIYFQTGSLLLSIFLFLFSPIIGKYSFQIMEYAMKAIHQLKFLLLPESKRNFLISEKEKIKNEVLNLYNQYIQNSEE